MEIPKETTAKIISMFQHKKSKSEISRVTGVTRKKVLTISKTLEVKEDIFNYRQHKNWLV